jgi:hypothetical protein
MRLRSLLVFSLFSVAACPPPAPSADAQADAQPEAGSSSDAQSDSGGSMNSSLDGSVQGDSSAEASASACCIARPGTNQSVCDEVAPFGPDRCNMIYGGTACVWSSAAFCNDGGSSMPDAANSGGSYSDASTDSGAVTDSGVAGCCRAREPAAQSTCDMLASMGPDRCNMFNGGGVCMWLTGAECRMDAGSGADSGVAGCCRAREPAAQSTCDALAPLGPDRCNMFNGGGVCRWTCG